MSWRKDQYVPSGDVVREVVNALIPQVASMGRQFKIPEFVMRASVWKNQKEELAPFVIGVPSANMNDPVNSELRIRFRRTIRPERSLYFAQLRMIEPLKVRDFAGLIVRGEVRKEGNGLSADVKSLTIVYNQCDWIAPAGSSVGGI